MTLRIEVGTPNPVGPIPRAKKPWRQWRLIFRASFRYSHGARLHSGRGCARRHPGDLGAPRLSDPVIERYSMQLPIDADWVIEVDFKPGVTDNEGRTAHEALSSSDAGRAAGVFGSAYHLRHASSGGCPPSGRKFPGQHALSSASATPIARSRKRTACGPIHTLVRLAHATRCANRVACGRRRAFGGAFETECLGAHSSRNTRNTGMVRTPGSPLRPACARLARQSHRRGKWNASRMSVSEHCKHKIFSANTNHE